MCTSCTRFIINIKGALPLPSDGRCADDEGRPLVRVVLCILFSALTLMID